MNVSRLFRELQEKFLREHGFDRLAIYRQSTPKLVLEEKNITGTATSTWRTAHSAPSAPLAACSLYSCMTYEPPGWQPGRSLVVRLRAHSASYGFI